MTFPCSRMPIVCRGQAGDRINAPPLRSRLTNEEGSSICMVDNISGLQSCDGMLAARLVANFPDLFSPMIHLAPTGAWLESTPSGLDFLTEPERRPGLLFKHPPVCRWSSTQRRARNVR
jgi:hypothetical protein